LKQLRLLLQPGDLRVGETERLAKRFGARLELLRRQQRNEVRLAVLYFGAGMRVACGAEDAVEPVVIAHRHRVELVVVTAGATQGEPEHGAAGRLERVFDCQMRLPGARAKAASQGDEPGSNRLLVLNGLRAGREKIARNLLAQKLVVGFVGVER